MHCQGVWRTARKRGGWKNQPITMVLSEKQFEDQKTSSLIYSSAQLALFPARKWVEYFAIRVKNEAQKDEEYQRPWK